MARGGRRPGAGRPKSGVTKFVESALAAGRIAREEFRATAQEYTRYALECLAREAANGSLPHIQELLDRAYGKITETAPAEATVTPPPPAPRFKLADFRKHGNSNGSVGGGAEGGG